MAKTEEKVHWVEFKSLKDLFCFVVTKSIPGQQFLSIIKYKEYTYTFTPIDDSVMIFFTKEEPKASVYAWDMEKDDCVPLAKTDKSKINILIQEVLHDSLIDKMFYRGKE